MSVGALIFEIIANTGRFETDTGRAAKIAEKRAKEIEKQFSQMGAKIGKALALVGGPLGLGLMVKNSIDAAAELDDLSQKTGIAVESLSRLQYAAGLEGVEDLGASLAKLSKTIATDSEMFKVLGIQVESANGNLKSTEDVLLDLADLFAKSADGTRKAALAQELFGKSGAALIPFLNKGRDGIKELTAEADRLGVTISGDTAKAADDFNNNMFRLKEGVKGAVNQITEGLLPSLNRISEAMLKSSGSTSGFEKAGRALGVIFETITVLGANVAYVFEGIGREIGGIAAQLAAIATGDFARAGFIREEMIADAERARKEIDAFGESVLKAKDAARPDPGGGTGILPDVEAMKKAAEEAAKAQKKIADDAQKEAEKSLQKLLDAEEKQRDSINGIIDALKEEAATMNATNGQIQARAVAKAGGTREEQEAAKALADYIDQVKKADEVDKERAAVIESNLRPIQVYNAEIKRLNELFENGTRDSDSYNRAIEGARKAFDDATEKAKESTDKMSVFAEQAARNMQDAFADFLFDPFSKGLDGMLADFAKILQRMAAEAAASEIFDALLGKGAGGSGGFDTRFKHVTPALSRGRPRLRAKLPAPPADRGHPIVSPAPSQSWFSARFRGDTQ